MRRAIPQRRSGTMPLCGECRVSVGRKAAMFGWTFVGTGGEVDRIQALARKLVDLKPDAIFTVTTPSVNAARRETRTIPIVFTQVTDPVAQGIVESLARPGGNITGITIFEPEIGGKWVHVLKEMAPGTTRVAVIFNPDTAPYYRLYMRAVDAAALSLTMKAFEAPAHNPAEIEAAISLLAREPAGGLIAMSDGFTVVHSDLIIALAARYRLIDVYVVVPGTTYAPTDCDAKVRRVPRFPRSCCQARFL